MEQFSDEQVRKEYNRKLLKNGFKSELINNFKNLANRENKELNFWEFLLKHIHIFIVGMVPLLIDFIKNGQFEIDTCIGSVIAILILLFCCWGVGKLK